MNRYFQEVSDAHELIRHWLGNKFRFAMLQAVSWQ